MTDVAPFVDADTHVYEEITVWHDYLDPSLRDRSPRFFERDGRLLAEIGGVTFPTMPNHPGMAATYGANATVDRSGNDPEARLARMDASGALAHVIFPTLGLTGFPGMVADPVLAAGFARAYNRYMADYCSLDPKRLVGAMILPFNHPAEAAAEARWAHSQGLRLAVSNPTPPDDRAWSDPFYNPIWATLAELGVPFVFHEITTGCPPHTMGVQRYAKTYHMVYLATHTVEPMLGMTDMIVSGTLQQFPSLVVMLAEAHLSWLPGWMALLDYTHTTIGSGSPFVKTVRANSGEAVLDMPPTEYFRRQCVISAFPDDPMLAETLAAFPDNVVISTDWPHPVAEGRGGIAELAASGAIAPPALDRLFVANARTLLGAG
jgi:predicted TIM-barrel fold metal-dependent hydrolase